MSHYAEDCILLDTARRRMLRDIQEAYKNAWLWLRRLEKMYGHAMSAESYKAIMAQRRKIHDFIPHLADFIDYMDEPEAWAPAEEPGDKAGQAMDELLSVIGPAKEEQHGK